MKKVLILTSVKTGSGHQSSSNAIEKKLKDRGFETKQVNTFTLMGELGNFMENSYIPLTTRAPFVYYVGESVTDVAPDIVHVEMYVAARNKLLKEIEDFGPDLIISVQCMFTKAISWTIRDAGLEIPFYVGVIDLIDPPSVWRDKRADITFVPTKEIRDDYIERGFEEDKVIISGFPVRDDIIVPSKPKKIEDRINILMVNTSTNLKKNIRFLEEVSKIDNISVDFICGLNKKLYKTLISMKEAGEIADFVNVHSFINNMNEFMANAHVILTKAGPNVIIESVRSGTAIVITGHIHGQEDNNYLFVTENGYGIRCEDPDEIYAQLNNFISSGKLDECLTNMVEHPINNGAEVIADYVYEHI